MKVDVEVQRTAEALDQGDRAGLGRWVGMARFLDQLGGNDAVNDTQHLTHDLGAVGEQEAQGLLGPVTLVTTSTPLPGGA